MRNFLDTMRLLGEKLAVILLQFPPDFSRAESSALARFLNELPTDVRFAVEFRHRSWYTTDTVPILKQYNVGWAATDYADLPKQIHITSDVLYIRWIGWHGRFESLDRVRLDVEPQLKWWWEQIQAQMSSVSTIHGFFNNDYAGHSPATCNLFKTIAGLPVQQPRLPEQGTLF
jgi:uncharacterized protein YecE (DUF72 family)